MDTQPGVHPKHCAREIHPPLSRYIKFLREGPVGSLRFILNFMFVHGYIYILRVVYKL